MTKGLAAAAVLAVAGLALALAGCRPSSTETRFPKAGRDVAPVVSDSFSTEDARDRLGEAEQVIAFAGVAAGMSVADVGAGEGYYTVRLSPVVGAKGRVLAEDIDAGTRDGLSERVARDALDNVAVKLGTPADPMLPKASFDRIFLVHMYHEVRDPYAFLWHLADGLKLGGEVILVDSDRPVKNHGISPKRVACEFAALGLKPTRLERLEGGDVYAAAFVRTATRPMPEQIVPCASMR
ncbi:MAG: methyltransferase domain-containing protein [Sphingomicrobium sp.]